MHTRSARADAFLLLVTSTHWRFVLPSQAREASVVVLHRIRPKPSKVIEVAPPGVTASAASAAPSFAQNCWIGLHVWAVHAGPARTPQGVAGFGAGTVLLLGSTARICHPPVPVVGSSTSRVGELVLIAVLWARCTPLRSASPSLRTCELARNVASCGPASMIKKPK